VTSPGFRCLLCAGADAEPVHRACRDTYLGTPFVVDYVRCRGCALLQQSPLPADVAPFYRSYPLHAPKSKLYAAVRWLLMSRIYYEPRGQAPGAALLDYGCGDGGYLEAIAPRGLRRLGYEPDPAQAERLTARLGVPVDADLGRLLREHEGALDAVTLHMVLEHLTDPDAALDVARRLLRPGGVLYVVVPHEDSLEARLFGRRWHNLDPPRHISFPGPAHVLRLAERHAFTLDRHRPVPFPNGFAASVPVVLTGRFRFALFALAFPVGFLYSRAVPTGSHAYWLTRR
jgi:SAM-dependent methyltransferase